MAQTTPSADNVVTKFLNEVFREYVRKSRFSKYQGKGPNNVITIKEDRKIVSIPLIAKLSGAGVSGTSTLTGNEEALDNYAKTLTPTYYRNAVTINNEDREKTNFDLFVEARPALMNWAKELQRDHIIDALASLDGVSYGAATAANHDAWLTNNADRVLYGASKSNLSAGDHTASLATVDTTNDKLSSDMVSLIKRIAKTADPIISPIKTTEDEDWYVLFVDSYGMRDLRADTAMQAANRDARVRGENNPLFTGGDLLYDGVIIREIEEITGFIDNEWGASATADGLNDAGNSGSRVGVGFLCGQQALGYGLGQAPMFRRGKEDDYEFQNKVAIELKHDIDKMYYNNKQHGVATVFYSSVAD